MKRGAILLLVALLPVVTGCGAGSRSNASAPVVDAPLSAPAAGPAGHGRRLLVRRCQNCHALPDPARYDRVTWEKKLARMHRKVRLQSADWDTLVALVSPADTLVHRSGTSAIVDRPPARSSGIQL